MLNRYCFIDYKDFSFLITQAEISSVTRVIQEIEFGENDSLNYSYQLNYSSVMMTHVRRAVCAHARVCE